MRVVLDTNILVSGLMSRTSAPALFVFLHSIWHEGAVVRSGQKFVLRADVMYGSRSHDSRSA